MTRLLLPARGLALACALLATVLSASASAASPRAYRTQLLRAINAARAQYQLPPLRLERHLAMAAGRYSRVLARTSQLTHDALGADPVTRVEAAGFRGRFIGEDLAVGMSAPDTVTAWLNSPTHREVLLSTHFRRVGLGVAAGSWAGVAASYVTADLGG